VEFIIGPDGAGPVAQGKANRLPSLDLLVGVVVNAPEGGCSIPSGKAMARKTGTTVRCNGLNRRRGNPVRASRAKESSVRDSVLAARDLAALAIPQRMSCVCRTRSV